MKRELLLQNSLFRTPIFRICVAVDGEGDSDAGGSDWANFRPLVDGLLWAVT
jgi:hypothetical protein